MALNADASELRKLGVDLGDIGPQLAVEARQVIQRAALNIKRAMREDMSSSRYFRGVVPAITYDTVLDASGITAEIGPVTGPGGVPGDLAHFAYFGGAHGGGGTVRDPQDALDDEAPVMERYLSEVVERLL